MPEKVTTSLPEKINPVDLPPGVSLHHADLTSLAAALPKHDKVYEGEPDMTDFDIQLFDALVAPHVPGLEESDLRIDSSWINTYSAGDTMLEHTDWTNPRNARTVVANIIGRATVFFPESGFEIEVNDGSILVLDGNINPSHLVESIDDRISVVGLYE